MDLECGNLPPVYVFVEPERFPGITCQSGFPAVPGIAVSTARSSSNHLNVKVATTAAISCAAMKAAMWAGSIPEKVLLIPRAIVTAGLANEVDEVNQ